MASQKVEKLYEIIQNAQNELFEIRDNCKHDQGYHVKNYGDYRNSAPTKLCEVCDEPSFKDAPTYEEAVECVISSHCFSDPEEQKKFEEETRENLRYLQSN
ncbi:hypothetical protein N9948_00985 [bacterium]|nr:hypothetical protein [bacterium]